MVLRIDRDQRPAVLACEKAFIGQNRYAPFVNVHTGEIATVGRLRQNLDERAFGLRTVKEAICGDGHVAKEEDVAKAAAARFPRTQGIPRPEPEVEGGAFM